jgi:glucose/arabinose dehydrogenase
VRRGRAIAAAGLLLASLAACGDDDDSTAVPDTTATTVTPTSAVPGAPTTTPPAPLDGVAVKLTEIIELEQPIGMAAARSGDFYVAEKTGRVRLVRDGRAVRTVLDLRSNVSTGGEQGLLGIALSPDERFFYVNYTDTEGDTHIVEYTTDGRNERELLKVEQPFANHNGGGLAFGPDGYLYIALGDGGSGGDPQGNGQNRSTLLGKLLRIDPGGVTGDLPYALPEGNPFLDEEGARPEIWALGLRNPWRFSFDRGTGDLWIGDVGQNAREEIDRMPSTRAGVNYGWNLFEGTERFENGTSDDELVLPVFEYETGENETCAVIGGYVYRGKAIPALVGAYLFSDSCGGRVEAIRVEGNETRDHATLTTVASPASFGEDTRGELYVLSLQGGLYRVDSA